MCVCVQGRVHHMTVKEDQSRRGAREEKGGKGAIAMATAPPPSRPDFQRGRKNFKSQPSALERLLLKGVHTAPSPPSARGQSWAPPPLGRRPRRPWPPACPPVAPAPRAPEGGLAQAPGPENSAASACPAPGGKKGVCVLPAGARTSPPFSRRPRSPAPLRSGADPLGRFLPPDRVDRGRRGAPRSFGDSASERFPRGLGERVRTNSCWGAQQLRRRRGSGADCAGRGAPRQKASAGAAAPPPLPSRSPIELTRTGD